MGFMLKYSVNTLVCPHCQSSSSGSDLLFRRFHPSLQNHLKFTTSTVEFDFWKSGFVSGVFPKIFLFWIWNIMKKRVISFCCKLNNCSVNLSESNLTPTVNDTTVSIVDADSNFLNVFRHLNGTFQWLCSPKRGASHFSYDQYAPDLGFIPT